MRRDVFLVSDQIYVKTQRYVEKLRQFLNDGDSLRVAIVQGFSGEKINKESSRKLGVDIITGDIGVLVDQIRALCKPSHATLFLVALNQSGVLPTIALLRELGLPFRRGFVEACNKIKTRELLFLYGGGLAVDFCPVLPGKVGPKLAPFEAESYVVKPAFGMSSHDVKVHNSWTEAVRYAESRKRIKHWIPDHVLVALGLRGYRTDARIIEPFIDGTEFSIDGWIQQGEFHAIDTHVKELVHARGSFV